MNPATDPSESPSNIDCTGSCLLSRGEERCMLSHAHFHAVCHLPINDCPISYWGKASHAREQLAGLRNPEIPMTEEWARSLPGQRRPEPTELRDDEAVFLTTLWSAQCPSLRERALVTGFSTRVNVNFIASPSEGLSCFLILQSCPPGRYTIEAITM